MGRQSHGKLRILLPLLCLLFGGRCLLAHELPTIELRSAATVSGGTILLQEIAQIDGEGEVVDQLAALVVGTAPASGSSRSLRVAHIEVRLRQAGIHPSQVRFSGSSVVEITRQTVVAASTPSTVQQPTVAEEVLVVAARKHLARGTVLSIDDVMLVSPNSARVLRPVAEIESVVGMRLTRAVTEGSILTESVVETVPLVERGNPVWLVVETGGIRVSTPGTARASGGAGDLIAVENTSSGEVVQGTIVAKNTVQVVVGGGQRP